MLTPTDEKTRGLADLEPIVTDSRGNQMLGLGKDDFVVRENGQPQAVDTVDYFTNRRLITEPEAAAKFKVERVHDDDVTWAHPPKKAVDVAIDAGRTGHTGPGAGITRKQR